MSKKLMIPSIYILLVLTVAFRYNHKSPVSKLTYISRQEMLKNKLIVQCSPDWNYLDIDSLAKGITILKGWGNYQWNITSESDSARLYFQQGINMYYSFHIIEAMASFKKAEQFDKKNAMIYWAQALAYGPNINDFIYSSTPEAYTAAQHAIELSQNSTPKEKALINAMATRYSPDSTVSRAALNQLYTNNMLEAYKNFPDDADVATLYADAMMLQHPWEYWKHNGDAQPWTPRILEVLEKTLQKMPNHPGANHYYIHSVEASTHPQKALPSADRLAKLMPSVSHMVHMPSHIYIRSGFYKEGIKVNELSLQGYKDYQAVYPEVANNAPLYLIHNLHMQTACAMMGSDYNFSIKSAEDCRASFDTSFMSIPAPLGDYVQYVYMTPVFNNIRFGKWDAILSTSAIPDNYVYANVLDHWARGIALAKKNDIPGAKKELTYLQDNMNKPDMQVVMQPFNAPVAAAKVAEKILAGIIAEQLNDLPKAISLFKTAVENETAMIYNEPRDWLLPSREWLGSALIKAGLYQQAERVFKEDLKENPNNHWSLTGLYESLQKQGKPTAAGIIKKQLDKTIATEDMKGLPVVF